MIRVLQFPSENAQPAPPVNSDTARARRAKPASRRRLATPIRLVQSLPPSGGKLPLLVDDASGVLALPGHALGGLHPAELELLASREQDTLVVRYDGSVCGAGASTLRAYPAH